MWWQYCRSQGCVAFWAVGLNFTLSACDSNKCNLSVFFLGFPILKGQRVRRIIGARDLSIEMRKAQQMKNGSWADISPLCCLMLQSVDHLSILESPKSSIVAAVGRADQQMLFGAQEGANYQSISLGCTVELSMVLKPGLRVSSLAPLVRGNGEPPLLLLPAFGSTCMWDIPCNLLPRETQLFLMWRYLQYPVLNFVVWYHQIIVVI